MMKSIEERITKVLVEVFKLPAGSVSTGTTFADLGFDSLVLVELTLVLGNEFGVPLEDGELRDRMTVAETAQVLVAKGAVP
jgi:acyl carrier protein